MKNLNKFIIYVVLFFVASVARAQVTVNVTNTNWYFSPYNWYSGTSGTLQSNNVMSSATAATSNNPGAYCKINWATTSSAPTAALNISLTPETSVSLSTNYYPQITAIVDGGAPQIFTIAATIAIAVPRISGNHSMSIYYQLGIESPGSIQAFGGVDFWTTPACAVSISSLTLDSAATVLSYTSASNNYLFFGDDFALGYQIYPVCVDETQQPPMLGMIFEGNTGINLSPKFNILAGVQGYIAN